MRGPVRDQDVRGLVAVPDLGVGCARRTRGRTRWTAPHSAADPHGSPLSVAVQDTEGRPQAVHEARGHVFREWPNGGATDFVASLDRDYRTLRPPVVWDLEPRAAMLGA